MEAPAQGIEDALVVAGAAKGGVAIEKPFRIGYCYSVDER